MSRRKRLADSDGVSAKATIDALVRAGVIPDDSMKYVAETRFSQEKGAPETTTVTIYELEGEEKLDII